MKNHIASLLTILALFSFISCIKEKGEISNENPPVSIGFNAVSAGSRAVFGEKVNGSYPVYWTDNDEGPSVSVNYEQYNKCSSFEKSEDGSSARFTAKVSPGLSSYKFIAVSPSDKFVGVNKNNSYVNVEIPSVQANDGNEDTPDEKAMVIYSVSEDYNSLPGSEVAMSFNHVGAYMHLVFTNLSFKEEGESVRAVHIEAPSETGISGRGHFYPADGTWSGYATSDVVSVFTDNFDNEIFAVFVPVDLSGKNMKFSVVTDKGSYKKEKTMGEGRQLVSGTMKKMTVNMEGVTRTDPVTFELVTDESEIQVGDQVLIVDSKADSLAISINQKSDNRDRAAVISNNGVIADPSSAVAVFTLEDGVMPGQYAFKDGDVGYLYYETGGNYLRTKESIDVTSSWSIDVENVESDSHGSGYIAFIKNNSESAARYIRCNETLFSAYVESSATRFVRLYKRVGHIPDHVFSATHPGSNNVSYAGGTDSVYVFGNVAWTATVSGDATLDTYSGTGPAVIHVTVPENLSTTDTRSYTVTVTTSADVTTSKYDLSITQGGMPKVGDVLYFENWAGSKKDSKVTDYTFGGTTVYGGSVTYSGECKTSSGNANVKAATGRDETLYLETSAEKKSITINGIPCKGIASATFSFVLNRGQTAVYALTSSTEGVTIGEQTQEKTEVTEGENKGTYYTLSYAITFDTSKDLKDFSLTLTNNHSAAIHTSNYKVIVSNVLYYYEDWEGCGDGSTNGALDKYEFGGTTVFGGESIEYSGDNTYTKTDLVGCYAATLKSENVMINKGGSNYLKIIGIPCSGIKTAEFSFAQNRNDVEVVVTSDVEDVSIVKDSSLVSKEAKSSDDKTRTCYITTYTLTFDNEYDVPTFNLFLTNTEGSSGNNVRITALKLVAVTLKE